MSKKISMKKIEEMVKTDIQNIPKEVFEIQNKVLYFSKSPSADIRFDFLEKLNKQLDKNMGIISVIPPKATQQLGEKNLLFIII